MLKGIGNLQKFNLLLILLVTGTLLSCGAPEVTREAGDETEVGVGVLKFGTHEVMDAVTVGLESRLKEILGDRAIVTVLNGQFDRPTMVDQSHELVTGDYDIVVTIATPATMAYLSVANGEKPLVFTFVTDPTQLGYHGTGTLKNTTGLSNKTDFVGTLQLVEDLAPSARRLGYLVSTSEPNATYILNRFREEARQFDIELSVAEISASAEVQEAAESLAPYVDGFLVGGDHGVVNAIDALLQVADLHGRPVFSVDGSTVHKGCVAASTINFEELGERTAEYVSFIVAGASAERVQAEEFRRFYTVINGDAARKFGVAIPDRLRRRALVLE